MSFKSAKTLQGKCVYVAGHSGMAGSALLRRLQKEDCRVVTADSAELDLRRQGEVETFLRTRRPDIVIVAAARVGGIVANDSYPVEFLVDNLSIELNVISASHNAGVERLMFLGSTCVYPRDCPQPMSEDFLLTGPLEVTNMWYAVAKIAGIKMCQAYWRQYKRRYITVMPTNLYGPGDNYHPQNSHVVAALLRRFHEAVAEGAESVAVWGSGEPRREFLHVDDFADACVYILENHNSEDIVNIGVGHDITIADLAQLIARVVGYHGRILFDRTKPDGTPRKLVDISKLTRMGWQATINLHDGLAGTYDHFRSNLAARREI